MEKIKSNIIKIVAVIIFIIVVFVVRGLIIKGYKNDYVQTHQRLMELENSRAIAGNARVEQKNEILKSTTNLDSKRQARDDEIMSNLFKQLFTWSNSKEYEKVRLAMSNKVDKKVLDELMPKQVVVDDGRGHKIDDINTYGISLTYMGMKSNVVNMNMGKYEYLTEVKVEGSDKAKNTASTTYLISYSVDKNGKVSKLKIDMTE